MKKMLILLVCLITYSTFTIAEETMIDPALVEIRYCGVPDRYSNGVIKRRADVVREFEKRNPLPEWANRSDYEVDHVYPLAIGGCDAVWNLQWLPKSIKRCSSSTPNNKDCFERKIYKNINTLLADDNEDGTWSIFQLLEVEADRISINNKGTIFPSLIR